MPLGGRDADAVRPLPKVAAQVDAALYRIDHTLNWLIYLSPLDNDAMWARFRASGYREEPRFRYPEVGEEVRALRDTLADLPMDGVEHPLLASLLSEKHQELRRFLELVCEREGAGFSATSTALFGDCEPTLLEASHEILTQVPRDPEATDSSELVTGEQIADAARDALQALREHAPDLPSDVVLSEDLNSMMMVNQGILYVARSAHAPRARLPALMAHEVGTHVVTHYNGSRQPLRQLEVGLANYDTLQEGLGAFSEYLAGYLSAERLRVLAARVLAIDLALSGQGVVPIFSALHDEHGFGAETSFDIAVRARRGGGLSKDLVYLRGLMEVHAHVASGRDLERLYLGKFSFHHHHILDALREEGWVHDAELLPLHLQTTRTQERLAEARAVEITELYQPEPEA